MSDPNREPVDHLANALQREDVTLDELARVRMLSQMAPTIDVIAAGYASPKVVQTRAPIAWLGAALAAAVVVIIAWRVLGDHAGPTRDTPIAHATIERDRHVLAPYVVSGAPADVATTLLSGKFAALDVATGLVRASVASARVAVVGPTRIAVRAVADTDIELDLETGTLLVDARGPTELRIHAGGHDMIARVAHVAVRVAGSAETTVVFVDRGEIVLDGAPLTAGQWSGPVEARSPALVAMMRDHGNAIAPPVSSSALLDVAGDGLVVTEAGAVIGSAPLLARVPTGSLAVVVTGNGTEQRASVDVHDGVTVHVAAAAPKVDPPTPEHATRPRIQISVDPPSAPSPDVADTASSMYAAAERALAAGKRDEAEQTWIDLLARFPASPQAASALYDLAGLARARGDHAKAIVWLDRLLAGAAPPAVREPAAYLRCRLRVDSGDDAAGCFRAFRIAFADSPHDAEVLAWLVGDAARSSCTAASSLAAEYIKRYPSGGFAVRARSLVTCEPTR